MVCPTPIGNLEDVTLRVLQALSEADVVACEDTRRTRKLLERHGLRASLLSLHEHNERQRAPALIERMHAGERVALVSDSGTPLVSDPGFSLVQRCLEHGLPVEVLPGPSAVVTGDIDAGAIMIQEGCVVQGRLTVTATPSAKERPAKVKTRAPSPTPATALAGSEA